MWLQASGRVQTDNEQGHERREGVSGRGGEEKRSKRTKRGASGSESRECRGTKGVSGQRADYSGIRTKGTGSPALC